MGAVSRNEGMLLPYQRTAAERIARALNDHGRAAVVAPPRTGKLLMVAAALVARPRRELLVLTPSVEAFQKRLRRLPEPLRSHMSEGRVVAYARVAAMAGDSLRRLWRPRVILDSFQRCGSERWGEAVRRLVDDPRNAEVIGISAYSLRPSDGGRDMVRELFGGRYALHMELPDAWASSEVPLEPPTFVEALLSWDDDFARMRSRASGIASPSARRMARERIAELEAALAQLGRSDGEVAKHIPRVDGHYVVYCSRVADVAFVRDRLVGWLKPLNSRIVSYQATYDVGLERARKAIASYSADRSGALKLLFVIDKLRDWGEVPCDGAFCFRKTRSVNVLAGQVAQASRLGGSGESVFVDLAGNLESAGVWEGGGPVLRERDRATRALLDYVSGHIVVTERTMRAAELLRRMDALLSGCGVKSVTSVSAEREWSREEDVILIDEYPAHGLKWEGWVEVLPNRARREIEKRAFVLGVKFGIPVRWSDQEDSLLLKHYPRYGKEWQGWESVLPAKTPRLIEQRARSLRIFREWSAEELERLRIGTREHGADWDGWRRVLPGRSSFEIAKKAAERGYRKEGAGAAGYSHQDHMILEHFETLGKTSSLWAKYAPALDTDGVSKRASALGVKHHKKVWLQVEDDRLRSLYSHDAPQAVELSTSFERRTAKESSRRAMELGLDSPADPTDSKKATKHFLKFVNRLNWRQRQWYESALKKLYPLYGPSWTGWRILIPEATPDGIRRSASRYGIKSRWQSACALAGGDGWSQAECGLLRDDFPVYSMDLRHWERALPSREPYEVIRMAISLGVPSWSEMRMLADQGSRLGLSSVLW